MFSFLKPDPLKKMRKLYAEKLEQAMHAQRNGDIRSYSSITAEAEDIYKKIQDLEASE